jgi:ribose transport system ATP-binding protein
MMNGGGYCQVDEIILEMKHITKTFPGVIALDDVNFFVLRGEVHALIGENGAGKSTLMKILDGVYRADQGEILLNGVKLDIKDTKVAKENGISLIFQEFNLISMLSVAENIFLGKTGPNWLINWKMINKKTQELLDSLGFNIKPTTIVDELSVAEKQMTEIAKALAIDAKIIVMDEPTATLTEKEIRMLFGIISNLKKKGITIIYISHRMEEVFEIADTVTILRDGKIVETCSTQEMDKNSIIEKMVGRPLDMEFPERVSKPRETILRAEHIFIKNILNNINFDLRKGEILGVAGLVGSGRTELARAIFGADRCTNGELWLNGKKVRIISTADAKRHSIGLVPEDRKEQGLAVGFSVMHNITISDLKRVSWGFMINSTKEQEFAKEFVDKLNIKTPTLQQKVVNLSGGNQQKVVLAKWLYCNVDILILDEPTRGIDVGAKYEIYMLMNKMVEQGKAIIMISSDMSEILGMSDRVLVMHDGSAKAILENIRGLEAATIMKAAVS